VTATPPAWGMFLSRVRTTRQARPVNTIAAELMMHNTRYIHTAKQC